MNKLISIINQILDNQNTVWFLLGTLVGISVSCIVVYAGPEIGLLVLGIWILLTTTVYWFG
jgi:hypothetical protein